MMYTSSIYTKDDCDDGDTEDDSQDDQWIIKLVTRISRFITLSSPQIVMYKPKLIIKTHNQTQIDMYKPKLITKPT